MRAFRSTLLLVAVAAGCVPPTATAAGEIAAPGVYPADRRIEPTAPRDAEWRPASGFVAALDLPGSLSSLLAAVPPSGSPVMVRSFSWPAPLHVAGFGADGVHLRGVPVPAERFSTELRCLGLPRGAPIGVSVRLVAAAQAVKVEARIEAPAMVACDISYAGRKRVEAVATDAWMWGRTMVARGSALPAAR
jgi:hypothetical protein